METEPQFERKSFDSKSRRNLADTFRYLFFFNPQLSYCPRIVNTGYTFGIRLNKNLATFSWVFSPTLYVSRLRSISTIFVKCKRKYFLKSLIIHEASTKKINTVENIWKLEEEAT